MRAVLFSIILLFGIHVNAATCEELYYASQEQMDKSSSKREKIARKLLRSKMKDRTYVARWEAKHDKAQGPFTKTGEILVTGVEKSDYDTWMDLIGKNSIGIGLFGIPESGGGVAYLRIGDKFFTHEGAAAGRKPKQFKRVFDQGDVWFTDVGLTEATIPMTPSEIKAILEFYEQRNTAAIVAQHDFRGYNEGEIIEPDYSHTGNNLVNESCAKACTSFLSDLWYEHMEDQVLANKLRKIRKKYNLNPNFVARANVWMNFRNPAAHATVMRTDVSKKDLTDNFINDNSWGTIRGLYPYAFMPDGSKKHSVESYSSYRMTLEEYLEDQ